MCGRFTLTLDGAQMNAFLADHFTIDTAPIALAHPRYNIAPGQDVLAIVHDGICFRAGAIRWGYKPKWATSASQNLINARGETVMNKPTFAEAFISRRCVFVADGFYEWHKSEGKRVPYHFYLPERRPFLLAGIYQKTAETSSGFAAVVLTTTANGVVSPIHHRMPVMFTPEAASGWLQSSPSEAHQHLVPFPDEALMSLAVDDCVNRGDIDDPMCLTPRQKPH